MKNLSLKYFFGIDTSKEQLDFALNKELAFLNHEEVKNNYESIKSWVLSKLEIEKISLEECCFCIEQTGIYCNHLVKVLLELEAHFSVAHSAQIKLSLGITRGKSDKVDAKRIAEYAFRYKDKLKAYKPRRSIVDQLGTLCKLRKKIMKIKQQLSTTLNELALFGEEVNYNLYDKHSAKMLEMIELEIKSITKDIARLIKSDQRIKDINGWLRSVVGVGEVAAPTVIVSTNEFTNGFTAKQMCSFCGVAPFANESGSSQKGKAKVSHKANKTLKTLLHMCAMAAIQTDSDLARFYHRKIAEGKNKMSALNAVRNKIIHRMFAVVAQERMYVKDYIYQPATPVAT